jgi:PmbA protein
MNADALAQAAAHALEAMRAAGFEHAQAHAAATALTELNFNDNEPTLLRSTEGAKLALLGIVDGRMASTELVDLSADAVAARVRALFADARSAPQDAANSVSSGERGVFERGPQEADNDALVEAVHGLLDYRARATPKFTLAEGAASHRRRRFHLLTTGGSELSGSCGWYELGAMGSAREGAKASSIDGAGGATWDLRSAPAHEQFGLGAMMHATERQVHTQRLGEKFVGDVVFLPQAVQDLVNWLVMQLSDGALIAGTSLYAKRIGDAIAAPGFTLRSRFDAAGVLPISGDGFVARPLAVVENGVLRTLLPTLYGSRKTGHAHAPTPGGGWAVEPGTASVPELVGGVERGALVGRLSMGLPAANGDFSGVIKNAFLVQGGEVGPALTETMIAGNMAQVLRSVVGASRETLDGEGGSRLPWLRIAGLHFS